MSYCLYLIATTRIPLKVNNIVQRLYINVVLDILIWGFNHYLNLFFLLYLVDYCELVCLISIQLVLLLYLLI